MGELTILTDFPSPLGGAPRTVRIYTPTAYHADPHARFGVLYLQDGQNVFADPASARYDTWGANIAIERLASDGLEPWILVGIDHAVDRFGEYSAWDYPSAKVKAKGEAYSRFLIDRVKPFIDAKYRTRPEAKWTGAMGSSLGGLISLYLGYAHADVFGRIGALSPTVMWSDHALFREWRDRGSHPLRIYLDAGLHEKLEIDGIELDYGRETREFYTHLKRIGFSDHELCLILEPGGQHSEVDWHRRLPFAFRWLLC
jgi:predicted alpha/beta superfamily hydrolase